jgi:predicted TIM-barrel fold metal-dependent hydrolase
MAVSKKPFFIAIEEHYMDNAVTERYKNQRPRPPGFFERVSDFGGERIKEMDEAGIDVQVLSHAPPGVHGLDAETAVEVARITNDNLAAGIATNPSRFAGFAALPVQAPKAAADELERCVDKLGFKGALISSMTNDRFLDDKNSWAIYERAEELDVPIYIHPGPPNNTVVDTYYGDMAKEFGLFPGPAWGYTVETGTACIRLVLSRVFEKYPKLKIIIGHFGETIPFLLWRIDHNLKRHGNAPIEFRDVFCNNFYVTTSGNFSDAALLCTMMEMGIDRILFAIDWPFIENKPGVDWMKQVPLCEEDRVKILSGNSKRLLKM